MRPMGYQPRRDKTRKDLAMNDTGKPMKQYPLGATGVEL